MVAININGTKTSNTSSIAQGFCDFFSTIAGVLKTKSFPLCNFVWGKPVNSCETTSPEHFVFSSVSDDEVFRELRNLKRNKSTGLDNLPPGMLKDAATIITKPLAYIINLSLQSGSVPMECKAAKVIPLFKSGPWFNLTITGLYLYYQYCPRSWKGLYVNSCRHTSRIMVCCHLSSSDCDPNALLNQQLHILRT